jgi:3-hydroxybutyryl-CoA dehydrogenase
MAVKRLGVVGSGIMGGGITEVAATAGLEVVLLSRQLEKAAATIAAIERSLTRRVEKGELAAEDRQAVLARISPTDSIGELADCDLVIESVVEDLETKRSLFAELHRVMKPGAILATNTSTFPVVEMAMATGRPEKVCGLHFFNPATLMPLVEIARPITACDETIEEAVDFARSLDKRPVVVKDRAGFIVNALLFPYLNTAVRLLESGVASMEDIDLAMRGGCGFRMGPFALLDLIGLDTTLCILDSLYEEYRDPSYAAVPTLRRMVSAARLGRKSGAGFYEYPEA